MENSMSDISPLSMTEEQINAAIMAEPVVTPTQKEITPTEEESVDEEQETTEEKTESTDTEEEESTDEDDFTEESEEESTESEEELEDSEELDDNKEESEEINYKDVYEKIFSPFKANGKTIKVDTPEEAQRLMQMGANYSKKMSALKPSLKVLKTLEKNDLLDQDKLNLLIDISKKKPEAIAKLLKDSELDPFNLDLSDNSEYTPETYTTSDSELELDEVLSNIRDTASYSETIDVISNKWDTASKQVLIKNPSLIETINEHVSNGTYAQIAEVMEKEKLLGKLNGLSDIEAYEYVGRRLHEQATKQSTAAKQTIKPTQKKSVDPSLRSRKKEASLNAGKSTKKEDTPFNPLSLSAKELDELDWSKYV